MSQPIADHRRIWRRSRTKKNWTYLDEDYCLPNTQGIVLEMNPDKYLPMVYDTDHYELLREKPVTLALARQVVRAWMENKSVELDQKTKAARWIDRKALVPGMKYAARLIAPPGTYRYCWQGSYYLGEYLHGGGFWFRDEEGDRVHGFVSDFDQFEEL